MKMKRGPQGHWTAPWREVVSREDAFVVWLAMPESLRTIGGCRAAIKEKFGVAPAQATIAHWSWMDSWPERAEKARLRTLDQITETAAKADADRASKRILAVRELHDKAIDLVLGRLRETIGYYDRLGNGEKMGKDEKPPIEVTSATGAKALLETAMLAQRHIDTLEGKVPADEGSDDRSNDHANLLGSFKPKPAPTLAPETRH
jgi:hypothetical protein